MKVQSPWLKDHAPRLRAPGTVTEDRLRNLCIRCDSCIRVCPTGGLVPEPGGRLWVQTPYLSGRKGGCRYDCNACGHVCPSGAIRPLEMAEKKSLKIGLAAIDKGRCIPFARKSPCLACQVACPVLAIRLVKSDIILPWGDALYYPQVIKDLCIGCGLCDAACPVKGEGAIRTDPV